MNEALKMQISAFVDGELPDNEAELLLRRLSQHARMRQQVAQYLEIGRAMRRDRDVQGMDQLRRRIAAALGDESMPETNEPAAVGSSFMTPATGVAVAAAVAAIALVALNQFGAPVDAGVQDAVAIDLAPIYTEPAAAQALADQPSERLRDYLRRHGDSSPQTGSNDILYRLATFELDGLEQIEPDGHLGSSAGDQADDASGDEVIQPE